MLKKTLICLLLPIIAMIIGCATPPEIVSTPEKNAKIAKEYYYQVEAQGSKPIRYYSKEGPSELKIDETSGHVKWSPMSTGSYDIVLGAKNKAGVDEQVFALKVATNEAYDRGANWGELLRNDYVNKVKDSHNVIKIIHFLVNNPSLLSDMAFRLGLKDALMHSISHKDQRAELSSLADIIFSAGNNAENYRAGHRVGKKLREDKIRLFDVGREKRKNVLAGKPKELAWKSGFSYGYAKNETELHYAVRIYLALPD